MASGLAKCRQERHSNGLNHIIDKRYVQIVILTRKSTVTMMIAKIF